MGLTKSTLQQIRRRPSRLVLTGLALVVTTFFLSGSVLFQAALRESLTTDRTSISAATDLVITPHSRATLSDEQVAHIAAATSVTSVAKETYGPVLVEGAGRDTLLLYGSEMDGPQSVVRLVSGNLPHGPGEVALPKELAERLRLGAGSPITLHPGKNTVQAKVSAIVDTPELLSGRVLTTPANATFWLGVPGWQQVSVTASDPAAAGAAITQALGKDFSVQLGEQVRQTEAERNLGPVNAVFTLLLAFVAVAVMAAMVIVSSTFRVLLTRDQKRLALLRCVGARPGQVVRSVLAEASVSGLVAGLVGTVAAWGAVRGALAIATANGLAKAPAAVTPFGELAICIGVTVLLAVLAAAPAAFAAARIPPVAAMSTAATRNTASKLGLPRRLLAAASLSVALLLGVAAYFTPGHPEVVIFGAVGSGMALFGFVLALGPVLLRLAAPALSLPAKVFGRLHGKLALRNLVRVPRRTAACAAVVMLGMTMVCAVLVVLSSFQSSAQRETAERNPNDAVVSAYSPDDKASLDPAVVDAVRKLPQVGAAIPVTRVEAAVTVGARTSNVGVRSLDLVADTRQPLRVPGGWSAGKIALSERQAGELNAQVGNQVSIALDGRTVSGTVAAIYQRSSQLGDIVLNPADMATLAPSAPIRELLINAAPGTDPTTLRGPLDTAVPLDPALYLEFPAEQRTSDEDMIGSLRAVALGLVGLTVLVSVVGMAITLTLSVVERTRESGVLRALGLRGSGLRSILAWEAALLALYAIVPSLVLGIGYGMLTVRAVPGFTVVIPWWQLGLAAVCTFVLALAASVLPARRTARTSPMQALADV